MNPVVAVIISCAFVGSISMGIFFSGIQYAKYNSTEFLKSIRAQTYSGWEEKIKAQEAQIDKLKLTAEKSMDAMASRLSLLQGHVYRLDALGSRLASMAKLDEFEFGLDNPPGLGGPTPSIQLQSINIPDFLVTLEELEKNIQDRSEKLSAIESMLINRTLQEQTLPTGNPVQGGWLSSIFGYRSDPITGKQEFHEGLDFSGKPGTPISAVAAGIVTWSGPRLGYGNQVEINHGSGNITRYAHNAKNLVNVGDKVEKGEVIAIMGSSGRSTGTHVHFEVLKNGVLVNPKNVIVSN
ncbi:MAG: Peptidase M23 protein [Gammaproteobacteria bacterium]|nr:Peptidase M23 protein [Gammaproteobacteria bacterium]